MNAYFSFGNLAIDDLVFADGTTRWRVAGGAAMWAALGMAVWTGRATAVAPFGPDYPQEMLPQLDFACKRALPNSMRHWGLYEDDGSRHFVSRRDSDDWERASPQIDDLDAGPYANCHLGPMPWDRASALVDVLRARGSRTISLDIHDRKLAGKTLEQYVELARRVDVFLPSTQDVGEYLPDLGAPEALRTLRKRLPDVAVLGIKCGSNGAIVHAAGDDHIIAVPSAAESVVDTTGAGDAFCGGFLAGYVSTADVREGALCGTVSAAYAISAFGPAGFSAVDGDESRERLSALRARVTVLPLEPR